MLSAHEDSAMSDFSRSHRRHHEYSYRLPTPPRIVVPPPTLTTDMPELQVGVTSTPGEEFDTSFLKELNLESIIQKNTLLEWAYERRRQAQMILPWLFLGPLTAAKDQEFLAREGITMLLAIRSRQTSMNGVLQAAQEASYEVATVEASSHFMLTGCFPKTNTIINQHIAKMRQLSAASESPTMGKALVFCESGNEKSAAVVAAYLMEMLDDFDHIKAMQVCQAQRFCVNFDDSIKQVLLSYWDILQARRAVAQTHNNPIQSPPSRQHLQVQPAVTQKRSIEETRDEEDVEMSDGIDPSDILRFEGRDNTPFQNS